MWCCLAGVVAAGKSRGYAFVEYERQKDMKEAYKAADGRKIEGRRILIDVERGRTVDNWCGCTHALPGSPACIHAHPGRHAGGSDSRGVSAFGIGLCSTARSCTDTGSVYLSKRGTHTVPCHA